MPLFKQTVATLLDRDVLQRTADGDGYVYVA
jgi:hypothetical protein